MRYRDRLKGTEADYRATLAPCHRLGLEKSVRKAAVSPRYRGASA